MEELTEAEITRHYNACLDSVKVIDDVFAGKVWVEDKLGMVTVNQDHLKVMLAKDFWGDRDMTAIEEAANRVTEGVNFPAYVGPDAPLITITPREFMDRLTTDELTAIVDLTRTDTSVKVWYDRALAGDVWMDHPDVDAGLSLLVSLGTITAERKTEIIEV